MPFRKTYMFSYVHFQQNLQLPIVILKESIFLDMHYHKTYMYINFQENRVKTQVMTVLTNLLAKKMQVTTTNNC